MKALEEIKWHRGVSAAYCPSSAGGHNFEIHPTENQLINDVSYTLADTIINKRTVRTDTMGLHILPPKFNLYFGDGEYQSHCDAAFIGGIRADYACTLFLSDPADYEGGELWVGGKLYKADQGHAVIYECGEPHHVTPVTQGERVCAVTWIQSQVQDSHKRYLLKKLTALIQENSHNPDIFTKAGEIHTALQKMWITR